MRRPARHTRHDDDLGFDRDLGPGEAHQDPGRLRHEPPGRPERDAASRVYNLREVDGTGQGRALVIDRNWRQTAQDPPPGTEVAPDTVITLTAVKYTDH
ncbi:hypothetical protein [Amycolatopsis vancoresmycina]|uniref:PASTA domain-containing protein n=1 Tax=Amycolatopsis vancoresmycina DSM 44592 TaxID=1292037 RepID=R1IDZ0_9PSEU|nr:hypothetical protein [Amycolatopsis vancoresmycina]EOD68619.1 hypothetical protein H480_10435 [Amycolatopsis vancoresmycina DSM 44592]